MLVSSGSMSIFFLNCFRHDAGFAYDRQKDSYEESDKGCGAYFEVCGFVGIVEVSHHEAFGVSCV